MFDIVTLTLKFDLLNKNFNLGHSFLTRRGRAFIFHMYIPCDTRTSMGTKIFDQVTLTFHGLMRLLARRGLRLR